jgi:16S rRNA (cytosine967-C5)-methyltransferase
MAYCWYRCSKGFDEVLPFEERLHACLYLCETNTPQSENLLPETYKTTKSHSLAEKINILSGSGISFNIDAIAPFNVQLSLGISKQDWLYSMLQQPRLFIRIRRNREKILAILKDNELPFELLYGDCIALPNTSPVDKLLPEDSYVVQDASSQSTGNYFQTRDEAKWWDCCSGAGGKSLLLKDKFPDTKLSVSDKRASILHNLEKRFRLYGHTKPASYVADVADEANLNNVLGDKTFSHIICDVPCTGSGTWARTPEQLYYFEEQQATIIPALQAAIATNASKRLEPGGTLYYITCSVFEKENEAVVKQVQENTSLQLQEWQLINGIEKKADSMFIAVMKKPH